MTVWWIGGLALVMLLGAALPFLRKTRLPPPPVGGWRQAPEDD